MNIRIGEACAVAGICVLSACGSSPTAPVTATVSTPATTTQPTTYTISGNLSATNGGQGIAGATVSIGNSTTMTGSVGGFSLSTPVTSVTLSVSIAGGGLVTRSTQVSNGNRFLTLDAISQSGGFDLKFYRELVRNGLEAPDALLPIEVWHVAPLVYLQTNDTDGHAVDPTLIDFAESTTGIALSDWTGGKFASLQVTRGTDTREFVSGWITIKWNNQNGVPYCGEAHPGNGGWINFAERTPGCRCAGQPAVPAPVIKHELGHMMGFWHTDSPADVMYYQADAGSCNTDISAREKYHAAIALKRPNGNLDPDVDPTSVLNEVPARVR